MKAKDVPIIDMLMTRRSLLRSAIASIPALTGGLGSLAYAQSNTVTSDPIADLIINVQSEKPEPGVLTVPYRGHWFYIDEADLSYKRTMGVLNSLVRLKIRAGGTQTAPVLTLPVGR